MNNIQLIWPLAIHPLHIHDLLHVISKFWSLLYSMSSITLHDVLIIYNTGRYWTFTAPVSRKSSCTGTLEYRRSHTNKVTLQWLQGYSATLQRNSALTSALSQCDSNAMLNMWPVIFKTNQMLSMDMWQIASKPTSCHLNLKH